MKNSKPSPLLLSLIALAAIVIFILILRNTLGANQNSAGARLYSLHCENCHMADGLGLRNLIPPLAGSDYLLTEAAKIACIIRYGQSGEIVVNGQSYNFEMPGNKKLVDSEISSIIRFVNKAWKNNNPPVPFSEVESELERCEPSNILPDSSK